MSKKNFVSSIEGKPLNSYVLHIDNLSRGRFIEETNFELYLKAIDGETSENPAVKGKYFSGRGEFYKPWLEIYYDNRVKFKSSKIVDLSMHEDIIHVLAEREDLAFHGHLHFPIKVNPKKAEANFSNGLLRVEVPLKEKRSPPLKIEVK